MTSNLLYLLLAGRRAYLEHAGVERRQVLLSRYTARPSQHSFWDGVPARSSPHLIDDPPDGVGGDGEANA